MLAILEWLPRLLLLLPDVVDVPVPVFDFLGPPLAPPVLRDGERS